MAQKAQSPKKTTIKKQYSVGEAAFVKLATKQQDAESSSPGKRQLMIADAAYLIAAQRDFQGDQAFENWLWAKKKIDALYDEQS